MWPRSPDDGDDGRPQRADRSGRREMTSTEESPERPLAAARVVSSTPGRSVRIESLRPGDPVPQP
jgi:hypothetical protein